jgi:hypothetical protein
MNLDPANLLVRSNYLAVAIFAPVLAAVPTAFLLFNLFVQPASDWSTAFLVTLLAAGLYLLPALRAIRRVLVNGTVIPPALVNQHPFVSLVATFFGGIGHFFFVFTMSAVIGIALAPEWPEEAKKIAGPLVLGLVAYLIALGCGELALSGKGESDEARASRSRAL